MVDVYLLKLTRRLEEPVEKFLRYFTPRRQEDILRYKFTADRNRTVWAELMARSVIAKKIARPIDEIRIERATTGKPYLVDSRLQISLAHSDNWAACSVGEVPSGVDVEENFVDALAIAQHFFAAGEFQRLRDVDGRARAEKFLCMWTLKESFAKLTGRGIDDTFAEIDTAELLSSRSSIVGKNFFVEAAVVGVCTERGFLPRNFTVLSTLPNVEACAP